MSAKVSVISFLLTALLTVLPTTDETVRLVSILAWFYLEESLSHPFFFCDLSTFRYINNTGHHRLCRKKEDHVH